MSNSLRPHGLQHARFPCPSLSLGVCSNSCPLSWWCHPTVSSSDAPFSSCPALGCFPVSQLFASGGQSIGASASVLPVNIQGWVPLRLTGLISLLSKGLSRVFSSTQFESINSSVLSLLYGPTLTCQHDYWKNHSFDCMDPRQGWQVLKREWVKVWELESENKFRGPVEFEGSTLGLEPLRSIREQ